MAVFVMAIAGCSRTHPAERVTDVADDDPQMNAAISRAKGSVQTFITALQSPKAGQSAFSVKAPFSDGGETEHMWVTPVKFDGNNFIGVLSNEPEKITTVAMGETVTVGPDKISDWMYIDNGKLVGGETLRVLRSGLSPEERAEFDKSVPFTIE